MNLKGVEIQLMNVVWLSVEIADEVRWELPNRKPEKNLYIFQELKYTSE